MNKEHAVIEDIRTVLTFNDFFTRTVLYGKEIPDQEIQTVRESCSRLAERGLYPFDTSVTDSELFNQIRGFVQKGLENLPE